MTSVPLFISTPHQCSYLDDEQAQSEFVHPTFKMTSAIYSQLIAQGFRRSGDLVYRPDCPVCQECIPVRIPVADFKPNRKQKRCLQTNMETVTVIKPAAFEKAHYQMYQRYQHRRHAEGTMANSSPEDYIDFLGSSWCHTRFVEFSIGGELAAIAVVDYLKDSLSAVYTFFDPKFSRYSLGVYAVLWQISQAQKLGLPYVYLGFWIKECEKMNYKTEYQPLEGLINRKWQTLETMESKKEMLYEW